MDAILFVCHNVKSDGQTGSPALFFLEQSLQKVEYAQKIDSKYTPHFFKLLTSLLNLYFSDSQAVS